MDRLMHKALSTIQPRRVVLSVLLALMNHNCDDQYTGLVTFGTQEDRGLLAPRPDSIIMAGTWNRTGHYIFVIWFLLSSFYLLSTIILDRRRLDVYHTSTHGVASVQI